MLPCTPHRRERALFNIVVTGGKHMTQLAKKLAIIRAPEHTTATWNNSSMWSSSTDTRDAAAAAAERRYDSWTNDIRCRQTWWSLTRGR